jgi:hypothetical protein
MGARGAKSPQMPVHLRGIKAPDHCTQPLAEADPVVTLFGRADLRRFQEGNALRRVPGRQRIHDFA